MASAPDSRDDDTDHHDVVQVAVGTMIGTRYLVGEHLGSGGMGTVHAAHDLLVDQAVALKFVRPSLASDQRERERLRAEVRLAQTVTSVNVARTFTLDEQHGQLFIVMELLRGQTLSTRLREGPPLGVDEATDIADQLLQGLSAAHARGILHRDIKPGNVKLAVDGRAVLMDFGMARPSESAAPIGPLDAARLHVPVTHTLLGGTPGYIAPEILRGRRGDVRADLYAFGVMVFEMFAGQPLFHGRTPPEQTRAHLEEVAPRVDDLRAEVPRHVADLIARLLAKEPDDRPASADEVRRALKARASRRRRWPWILLAGGLLAGGVAVLAQAPEQPAVAPPPPIDAASPAPVDAAAPPPPAVDAAPPPPIDAGRPPRKGRPRPPEAPPPVDRPAPPVDDAAERRRRQLDLQDL